MHAFSYIRPASLADAVARLAADPQAKPLSGGMTLLPTMKMRLATPTALVDLARLPELRGIARDTGAGAPALRIGAATRHAQIAADATVRETLPMLAALAGGIGDPQVRNRGTLGGAIANNDPSADYPAALLALGATVITDRRSIAAEQFFLGMFETALAPGELVVAVRFPLPRRAAYAKFPHPASGYAMAGVCVAEMDGALGSGGTHAARSGGGAVRVAVTGAGPSVFRWEGAEQALSARFSVDALAALAPDPDTLNSDMHAPAEYRANLVQVMARRAVAALTGEHA